MPTTMTYPHPFRVAALLSVSACLLSLASAEIVENDSSIAWQEPDGEVVWKFNYGKDAGKPYFHPLRVPGGPELTKLRPEDHVWHYGLWFSWKLVNGVNYWEEDDGKADGLTSWKMPRFEKLEDGRTIIRLQLEYVHPSGRIDLREYRDLVISEVNRGGKYSIDWTSHFTAGEAGAYLDRTPLPHEPDGKLWGGYAGLSVRLAHGDDPVEFITTQGPLEVFADNRSGPKSSGLAMTVFPNERHAGSIAILADRRNMGGAHPWYLMNDQPSRFACAAVLMPAARQLEAGEVWELSYRIVIRPKAWDVEDLEIEMARWLR